MIVDPMTLSQSSFDLFGMVSGDDNGYGDVSVLDRKKKYEQEGT